MTVGIPDCRTPCDGLWNSKAEATCEVQKNPLQTTLAPSATIGHGIFDANTGVELRKPDLLPNSSGQRLEAFSRMTRATF